MKSGLSVAVSASWVSRLPFSALFAGNDDTDTDIDSDINNNSNNSNNNINNNNTNTIIVVIVTDTVGKLLYPLHGRGTRRGSVHCGTF
ncbi:hypothetical protein ACLKA7_011909 [Drosophila subpalustris]